MRGSCCSWSQVDIVERNNRAEVRTRYPQGDEMRRNNRRNFNVSVAYNVTAPAGARVRATSISGSITARDIRGDVSAESVSGTVRIINGGRVASAKSISGDVEVTESEIDGSLNASSASGNVLLRKVKARQLEVGSISGDVVLEDVDAAQVEGQTVSGNVRFGGALARGRPLRAHLALRQRHRRARRQRRVRGRSHLVQRLHPLRLLVRRAAATPSAGGGGVRCAAWSATAARSWS